MKKKRTTPTLEERIAADPELQEIFAEDNTEWMLRRLKERHREQKARAALEAERAVLLARRKARLRRLTFGLLGR